MRARRSGFDLLARLGLVAMIAILITMGWAGSVGTADDKVVPPAGEAAPVALSEAPCGGRESSETYLCQQ
jgi:hypothetical protein